MGVLYLARDPRLDRTVAIKVLSDYSAELHERFAREARSAAALKHPHIITIYDVGEDEGRPFLAMEYIDGETLGELIRRRPLLTVARKLQILRELCSGLSYAHRRGIIHRDIKPANVMITSEGSIKILDFGLARIMTEMTNAGLTQTGALMGTPHYMAPEQVDGKRADERSDIFAVGVVMYELLSYQKAFSGNSPHVVLHRIMTTEPPPLGEVCPDLDPELERIVHRAIEKDPDRRYQDLVALGADLSHVFERLTEGLSEPTVRVERAPGTRGDDPPSPAAPAPWTPPNLNSIAQRRAAQIAQYLREGQRHLHEGRFEAAIEQCELAAVLDPQDGKMLDLLQVAHRAIDDRKVMNWLDEARQHLSAGAISAAEALIHQSLQLRPESTDARQLQRALEERRREQERARERARLARSAIERARTSLAEQALEAALRAVNEALGHDRTNEEALSVRDEVNAALAERRRAFDAAAEARQLAADGAHQQGLDLLRAYTPRVGIIEEAAAEIADDLKVLERRREQERRREAEEARRRAEEDERLRQDAQRRRKEQEEEERQRAAAAAAAAAAEAEKQRQAEEEQRRRAAEEEEEARQREQEKARQRDAETVVSYRLPPADQTGSKESGSRKRIVVGTAAAAAVVIGMIAAWPYFTTRNEPAPSPTPVPSVADTPPSPVPPPVPLQQIGVAVNAVPWARVQIIPAAKPGEVVNRTTPFSISLPEGDYRFEFQHPVFGKATQTARIARGASTSVLQVMPGADVDRIVSDVLGAR